MGERFQYQAELVRPGTWQIRKGHGPSLIMGWMSLDTARRIARLLNEDAARKEIQEALADPDLAA